LTVTVCPDLTGFFYSVNKAGHRKDVKLLQPIHETNHTAECRGDEIGHENQADGSMGGHPDQGIPVDEIP
jgi:hypothetical protein